MYYSEKQKLNKGFTLIEVLVSLALFTIVVTISVGTLLVLIDANAKAQSQQLVMSNLSFALDSMTRDIRTGTNYYCAQNINELEDTLSERDVYKDCNSPQSFFSFVEGGSSVTIDADGSKRILYYLNQSEGKIYRRVVNQQPQAVTTDSLVINDFDFLVTGSNPGDTEPPMVSIYIDGNVSTGDGVGSDFNVQTTVTQQSLDI